MRARDGILLVFVGVILTLAVGGYLFWESQSNKKSDAQDKVTQLTQNKTTAKDQNSKSQNSSPLQLQVQGAATNAGNGQNSNVLPEPSQYSQYEQYKDSEGALYADPVVGNGAEVVSGDLVAVTYKGWLTDGQLFDQTKKNDQGQLVTFNFTVGSGQVIPGWEQGIVGMRTGGKRRLIIPPALGYGASGQGVIPPNAVLVFDIELIAINPEIQDQGL